MMAKVKYPGPPKPEFALLKPTMSREEKINILKAALIKSGFRIIEDNKPQVQKQD